MKDKNFEFIYFLMKNNYDKATEIYDKLKDTGNNIDLYELFFDSCKSGLVNKAKKIYNFSKNIKNPINIFCNQYEIFTYCYEKKYLEITEYLEKTVDDENELLKIKFILSGKYGKIDNLKLYFEELIKKNQLNIEIIKIAIKESYTKCYFDIVSWLITESEKINLSIHYSLINNLTTEEVLYERNNRDFLYYYDYDTIFSQLCSKYEKLIFVMKNKILLLSPSEYFVYEVKRRHMNIKNIIKLYFKYSINIHANNEAAFRSICNRGNFKMAIMLWKFCENIKSPIDIRVLGDEVFRNSMKFKNDYCEGFYESDRNDSDYFFMSDEEYANISIENKLYLDLECYYEKIFRELNRDNGNKNCSLMSKWLCSICDDYVICHDIYGEVQYKVLSDNIDKISILDDNEKIQI